ncbi:MAG: hypothetical protein QXH32_02545 [Candidatus Caldarchaeum sp.]
MLRRAVNNIMHVVSKHRFFFLTMVGFFTVLPVLAVFLFMLFAGGNVPTYFGVGDFVSLPLLFTDISLERKAEIFLGEGIFYIGYLDPKGALASPTPNTYVYYVFRIQNMLLQTPMAVMAGVYLTLAKHFNRSSCQLGGKPTMRHRPLGFSGLIVDTWAKIHLTLAPFGACPTCIAGNVFTVSIATLSGLSFGSFFSTAATFSSYLLMGTLVFYTAGRQTGCDKHFYKHP